jgi:type II secretory pathway predicted ATPase ExeA
MMRLFSLEPGKFTRRRLRNKVSVEHEMDKSKNIQVEPAILPMVTKMRNRRIVTRSNSGREPSPMYETYWGLRFRPFHGQPSATNYVPSPAHDEALARLHYLIEGNHRVGLLLGGTGTGKSLVLNLVAEQWRRLGATVAKTSLRASDVRETLWSIASGCGADIDLHAPPFEIWHAITNRLAENRWQDVPTIVLLDDADRAANDVLDHMIRLVYCEPTADSRLTVVLAAQSDRLSELGNQLLGLVELRIDLPAWDLTDTHNYLTHCLARAGRPQSAFAEDAVMRIHELAEGIVRRIGFLADLSLLAAAAQQLPIVDVHTVETVFDELGVMETVAAIF